MRVAIGKPGQKDTRRHRRADARHTARPLPVAPAPRPAAAPPTPSAIGALDLRTRRGGGPEDQAFYSCPCGYGFEAPVSTSVRCPHCGDGQAW